MFYSSSNLCGSIVDCCLYCLYSVCDVETLHLQIIIIMWPTALLLGDSQTQLGWSGGGWVSLLAEKYVRRVDIINRGLSGYNTRMLLQVLPEILEQIDATKIKIVTLMMGSNDASLEHSEQAVPVEEFYENMLKIVTMLLNHGIKREAIILISPPPVIPDKWMKYKNSLPGPVMENYKDNELTKKFAVREYYPKLAFVDLFSELMKSRNLDSALSDGLHLDKPGHKTLFDLLTGEFDQRLDSKMELPEWRELVGQQKKA